MEYFIVAVICFLLSLTGFPVMWAVEWLEGREKGGKE